MKITLTDRGQVLLEHDCFSLKHTFTCGQCFRFESQGEGYLTVARGRPLYLEQRGNRVLFDCGAEEFEALWRDYFDLDRDYDALHGSFPGDAYTRAAVAHGRGLRLLRQEPWEALCSFLISQCNNIPRIQSIISALCRLFGDEVEYRGQTCYTFPDPQRFASLEPEDLAPIRAGYRAKYILSSARRIAGGADLSAIAALETDAARKAIMAFDGVGRKVADCFLLFGTGKWDAFPVDTWMKKAAARYDGGYNPAAFGPAAGLAQQYIFYYARDTAKKSIDF